MEQGPILPPHGGFRNLECFRLAEYVVDGTVAFCRLHMPSRSRTTEQMTQAARSGKQNIGEGSSISGTSKKLELNLTGVSRASLEELKLDLEDYLRLNNLRLWGKEEPKAQFIRKLAYREDKTYTTYQTYIEEKSAETGANTLLCMIHQACFLLDRLKKSQETKFIEECGLSERMHNARIAHRRRKLGDPE